MKSIETYGDLKRLADLAQDLIENTHCNRSTIDPQLTDIQDSYNAMTNQEKRMENQFMAATTVSCLSVINIQLK